MAARGRKSAASKQVAKAYKLGDRPLPPTNMLRDRAIEEWNTVTNAMPSDWFTDETLTLLEAYCNHVANADMWNQQLQRMDPNWMTMPDVADASIERFEKFNKNYERETRAASSLATRMRITQQATYTPKAGGTGKKGRPSGGRKPWETGAITNGAGNHDDDGEE